MQKINDLLQKVVENKASDLHLSDSLPPTIRVAGVLRPLATESVLTSQDIKNLVYPILNERQIGILEERKELDLSYSLEQNARFRINVFHERENLAAAFRLIPLTIPTFDELSLPPIMMEFCKLPQGLVLLAGSTGTGKSTTLAAMINWMNQNRNAHIITIEDPIEFIFKSDKCLIQQREMDVDTNSWTRALKYTLRQDPNIIMVGEMRDYETIAAAITVAETGHLVLATLHTNSAAQTVDRIVDVFPEHQQAQIRIQLAAVIEGVITQLLIPGIQENTRHPSLEILIANSAVRNTVREGNSHHIDNIINTSYDLGMRSMERSLAELVSEGKIELEEAQARTLKPDQVIRYLKGKK